MNSIEPQGAWVVVDIGCLECGYATEVRGVFPSLKEVRRQFPDAPLRTELPDEDNAIWNGSSMIVVFPPAGAAVPS